MEEVDIKPHDKGVEIRFPVNLAQDRFNALMDSLRRNRDLGNLTIDRVLVNEVDESQVAVIHVGGIEDCVPQFVTTILNELMIADIMPHPRDYLNDGNRILKEFLAETTKPLDIPATA
jgi:hypothetical protein